MIKDYPAFIKAVSLYRIFLSKKSDADMAGPCTMWRISEDMILIAFVSFHQDHCAVVRQTACLAGISASTNQEE